MAEVTKTNTRIWTAENLTDLQALGSNDGVEADTIAYATNQTAWLRPNVINPTNSTWITISGGASDLSSVLLVGNTSGGTNIVLDGGGILTTNGQNLTLSASTGVVTTPGDFTIGGKLTVTGLIDPTGLLLNGQVSPPVTPTGNDGLVWVNASGELVYDNASGTTNITQSLLSQSTFLDAFSRAQWGSITSTTINAAATGNSALSNNGFLKDSIVDTNGGGSVSRDRGQEGIFLSLTAAGTPGDWSSVRGDSLHLRREQSCLVAFKIRQQDVPTQRRLFVGLTNQVSSAHAADADPGGAAQYVGVLFNASGSVLRFTARNGSSTTTTDTSVAHTNTSTIYVVIDMTAGAGGDVVTSILDEDFNVLDSDTINASAPVDATTLRPMTMVATTDGSGVDLNLHNCVAVIHADKLDALTGGGGGGGGSQTLSQVLTLGNATGGTNILFTDGDQIIGQGVNNPTTLVIQAADSTGGNGNGGDLGLLAGDANGTGDAGDINLLAGAPQLTQGGDGGNISLTMTDGGDSASVAGGLGGGLLLTFGDGGNATAGSGNGGDASDASWLLGTGGNSAGGTPGAGGSWDLTAGDGGNATGGSGAGGVSGGIDLTAGDGGTSVGGAGGNASPIQLLGGIGGAATGGTGNGGDGSSIVLTSGDGGATTGGTVGAGGNIDLTVGSGSVNGRIQVATAATNPSPIVLKIVDVGTGDANDFTILGSTSPDSDGGDLTLTAGSSSAGGVGGAVNINSGAGPAGGEIALTGGSGSSTIGGSITLTAGQGSGTGRGAIVTLNPGSLNDAGNLRLEAGAQVGNPPAAQTGGDVTLTSGAGSVNAAGAGTASGELLLETAVGILGATGDGGATGRIILQTNGGGTSGSTSSTGGASGDVEIRTGAGGNGGPTNSSGGNAGDISVLAGNGGSATGTGTQGDGGTLSLVAGSAGSGGAGGGTGGSVILTPGFGDLADGTIQFSGLIDRDASGYKHGIISTTVAVTAVVFTTPFPPGPPITVQITAEGSASAPMPVHYVHTVSATGFSIEFVGGAPPIGTSVHWTARQ